MTPENDSAACYLSPEVAEWLLNENLSGDEAKYKQYREMYSTDQLHQYYLNNNTGKALQFKSQEEEDLYMAKTATPSKAPKMLWYNLLEQLETADRILLLGPPGTGKSTTAVDAATKRKKGSKQAFRLTMTEGAGIEDLLGMFHLCEGKTVWMDGPAVSALRKGGTLLLDEVDRFSPEVGSLLYALLDDHPMVTLPTGEVVVAAPGYRVIATSNNNVQSLPEAIIDRFEVVLIANVPHPEAIKALDPPEKAAVANYYKNLPSTPWNWSGMMTVRRMRAFNKLRKVADETHIADIVFGKAGKEVLSALTTAGR